MAPEKDKEMFRLPETPQPRKKTSAIEAALQRFDEENSVLGQGSEAEPRLKHQMAPKTPPSRKGLKMHPTTYAHPSRRTSLHRRPLIAACLTLLVAGAGSWLYWHDPSLREPVAQREVSSADEDAGPAQPTSEEKAPPTAPEPKAAAEGEIAASEPQPAPPPAAGGLYDYGAPSASEGYAVPQAAPGADSFAQSYAPRTRAFPPDQMVQPMEPVGRDRFDGEPESGFHITAEDPVSTFSIDVDTASYSFVRSALAQNVLPQPDAVRTEELINYFDYDYALPDAAEEPFATDIAIFPSPWAKGRKLIRIGIQGYEIADAEAAELDCRLIKAGHFFFTVLRYGATRAVYGRIEALGFDRTENRFTVWGSERNSACVLVRYIESVEGDGLRYADARCRFRRGNPR